MGGWPLAPHAQQKPMPVIGFLGVSSLEKMGGGVLLDFKRGLAETGYVEDRNVRIEYRWAEDHYDRLPALAMELVQRHVKVLAAPGSPAALPAKAATAIIPIVFMIGSESGPAWTSCKLQPSGRQSHRLRLPERRDSSKAP